MRRSLSTAHFPYRGWFPDLQGAMPALLVEMCVFSAPGVVEFLPAMPEELPRGRLEGVWLYTWGKLEWLEWEEKGLRAALTPLRDQTLTLRCRRKLEAFLLDGEGRQPEGDHVTLPGRAGETLQIELRFADGRQGPRKDKRTAWTEIIKKKPRKKQMVTGRIVVVPYREAWEQDFSAIAAELRSAVGDLALRIEHVGSTAVPGLSAKPIIDIDVVIPDNSAFGAVASRLEAIGYRHEGDLGIPGREAFDYSGKEHLVKHHLYVCPEDSAELRRHLAFRDYLRSHPQAAGEYSRLKKEGARLHPDDIEGYIAHKAPFIEKVYREIGLE